jgi:hypothetical protein
MLVLVWQASPAQSTHKGPEFAGHHAAVSRSPTWSKRDKVPAGRKLSDVAQA